MKGKKSSNGILSMFFGFSLATWINSAISIFVTPIATTLFSPGEFGKIKLFLVYVNLLLSFSYIGMDQAFTRFYNEPVGRNTKKSLATLNISMSLFASFILVLGVFIFGSTLSNNILGYTNYVIPVSISLSLVSQIVLRYLNLASRMQKNYLYYTLQSVSINLITKVSYIFVAFWKPEAIYGIISVACTSVIVAIIFFILKYNITFSMKIDKSRDVLTELFKYAIPIIPVTILSIVNNNVGQLMLNKFVDYTAIGIYSSAITISSIITILQSGFNVMWSPFVFENYKSKQRQIINIHHIITVSMISLGILIIIFQDLIYLLLVNERYWGGKFLFPFLLISPISYTISETLGLGIKIEKKTYLNIPIYLVSFAINIILNIILLPKVGISGAAIAAAISSIVMLSLKTYFGEKYYKCSDNYYRMVISILVLVSIAFINLLLFNSIIKYLIFILSLIGILLLYLKEVKQVYSHIKKYLLDILF